MSEGILVALIGFAGVIVSNIITSANNNKKLVSEIKTENNKAVNEIRIGLETYKATTNEQIKELTREVREHNNFAKRIPVVETDIKNLNEKVNHFHNI